MGLVLTNESNGFGAYNIRSLSQPCKSWDILSSPSPISTRFTLPLLCGTRVSYQLQTLAASEHAQTSGTVQRVLCCASLK
jgi:hypothetical protein